MPKISGNGAAAGISHLFSWETCLKGLLERKFLSNFQANILFCAIKGAYISIDF